MKIKFFTLAVAQAILIFVSGKERIKSWSYIDFMEADGSPIKSLVSSNYLLIAWLLSIVLAMGWAIRDKKNRGMIVLFLVLLLPCLEFLTWFFWTF